jgi:anaerobic dimethyl sulfoxide reductase subunit A
MAEQTDNTERIVNTVCSSHCGGACPLKVHVKGDVITRLETDADFRACLRGRAYRQRVHGADRIHHPLKRTGKRGSGEFTPITWDEAMETVAAEINRVNASYGPSAMGLISSGGDIVHLNNPALLETVLAKNGGFSGTWGMHSAEGAWFASIASYGEIASGNTRTDLVNASLIIMWGWNPSVTISYDNTAWRLARAKEAGARIVTVDPRYSDSTAVLADQWIPIRPGTDTAMLIAMAHVIIQEDLLDRAFLEAYTTGFEEFAAYVTGQSDGVPKTPDWAEKITGVPAATITALARDYATTKPAALFDGIAPGRTAYGEQFHRAAVALAAMTGNIGNPGGNAPGLGAMGGRMFAEDLGPRVGDRFKDRANPVEKTPPRPFARFASLGGPSQARVNRFHLADAILKGRAGGYPADYKMLYILNCNYVNQCSDTNKIVRALNSLEFIVVQEQFMTATARYADIILPTNTYMERNDICGGGIAPFFGYQNRAVPSQGESKSHFEISDGLAAKLGVGDWHQKPIDDWLREVVADSPVLPEYEVFQRQGIHKLNLERPTVCFERQISDPANHPFKTPSGKIEIFSQAMADADNPLLPPIPQYLETWENLNDPLTAKYPLQLVTTHTTRRAHTQFENLPWLRELYPQAMSLHPADAAARGIRDGDTVRVFNDRGEMLIRARVTQRIIPGVVDIPQGAWYDPDESGACRGGCVNVLSRDAISPGGAFPSNTALVEVAKA